MAEQSTPFFERPILNSPYAEPTQHHPLDADGQPLNEPPRAGRRKSELITPVPRPRKKKRKNENKDQGSLDLQRDDGLSTEEQEYNPTPIINEIRGHVGEWRRSNPAVWGITPATARLLDYWRSHQFQGVRPFFCQVEAVETVIWLTEVAKTKKQYSHIWEHILGANEQANPELLRLAMKMATGAGKTTVMAMLIAWQTVNAVRSPTSTHFSRGFLIIAPGITIKDRLRVFLPSEIESYYRARELVPGDMLDDVNKAKIVITNFHALQLKEILEVNRVGRSLLQGRHAPIATKETEGQMLRRVAIGTIHLAKGLEYKAVAVMACDDDVLPLQDRIETVADKSQLDEVHDTERNLLYVACTCARDRLLVSGVKPASEFFVDFSTPLNLRRLS